MLNWFRKKPLRPPQTPSTIIPTATASGTNQLDDSVFRKNRGDHYSEEGKLKDAAECYRQAISINPGNAEACCSLGILFLQQDLFWEAERYLEQAIFTDPSMAKAYYFLGAALHKQDKLDEAIASYSKALELKPDAEIIYRDLCYAHFQSGQYETAKQVISRGMTINPGFADFHSYLGNLYCHEKEFGKAAACYQKALAIQPSSAEVLSNLGKVLQEQGKLDEASACYRKALEIQPDYANAHYDLGLVFQKQEVWDDAMDCYCKALAVQPNLANAHYGLGVALVARQRNREAIACFRRTLELEPDHFIARAMLLHQLQHQCEWEHLETNIKAVRQAISEAPATGKNLYPHLAFLAIPGATAEEQKCCTERWAQDEFKALVSLRKELGFEPRRTARKVISVGYISADFRQHPVSFLTAEMFELHDRSRFRIVAYSYGPNDGSMMRKRLENAFDDFVDIRGNSNEDAARKIHADHIDILVDLTGHTQNARSGILALRPAPIQINYLGYPGTMGADFIDYMIADRFTIPPEKQRHYTEKVIWMPDCFQANDRNRTRPASPSRKDCGLPEGSVVFCCFNQTFKITPEIFGIWCQLLRAVPGSILWLPASNPQAEANLRREAEDRGIAAERLIMAPLLHYEEYLARLQCADLFLDTLPFNAGTTCSDALWMGLPVVTCAGDSFASRMAGSLLTAIDIPELITYTLEDYFNLALDLATDRNKLDAIRSKIIANRDTAPLFDSKRFTRHLEKAYIQMMDVALKKPAPLVNIRS